MKEYLTTEGEGLTITYTAPAATDSVIYTVTDIDLDEVIFADEATDSTGNTWLMELSSDICKYDRKLRITIEMLDYGTPSTNSQVGTNGSYNTDYLDVSLVRPYVTADELASELGLTITEEDPANTSEIKRTTLQRYERQARMFINSQVNDNFRFQYKTLVVIGEDTDVLFLGERIESFNKIIKDDEVIFDTTSDPEVDLLNYDIEISKSKYQLKPISKATNIDEGKAVYVIVDPGVFEKGSAYHVRGEYGWKFIPVDIREATILLVDDMRCNDWSYRNKGLASLKNDGFDIEFTDSIFLGTGNILVDSLLAPYKSLRFMAI